jgi:hypothetical protein
MSEFDPNDQPIDAGLPSVSPARRSLLKLAASAAPLVATLPCGAAWANNSAYQCVSASKTRSDTAGAVLSIATSNTDGFSRVIGLKYSYRKVTARPPLPPIVTTAVAYGSSAFGTTQYMDDGTIFNPTGWSLNPTISPTPSTVYLMVLFTPVYSPSDPTVPVTVSSPCTPGTFDSIPSCVYPASRRQTGVGGNMGIYTSCLLSVQAGPPPDL